MNPEEDKPEDNSDQGTQYPDLDQYIKLSIKRSRRALTVILLLTLLLILDAIEIKLMSMVAPLM